MFVLYLIEIIKWDIFRCLDFPHTLIVYLAKSLKYFWSCMNGKKMQFLTCNTHACKSVTISDFCSTEYLYICLEIKDNNIAGGIKELMKFFTYLNVSDSFSERG